MPAQGGDTTRHAPRPGPFNQTGTQLQWWVSRVTRGIVDVWASAHNNFSNTSPGQRRPSVGLLPHSERPHA
jgi:hypothetical protein